MDKRVVMTKQPFKQHIKKYRSWATKKGYPTKDINTLLWYFNRAKAIKITENGGYWITYKKETYLLKNLIEEFKL